MNIDDTPLLSGDKLSNELVKAFAFKMEKLSDISNITLPSLNYNENSSDLQSITREDSLLLNVIENDVSDAKVMQEENENKSVNSTDRSSQKQMDTFDKQENRNTPISIILEKNNSLYRERKNSYIFGRILPNQFIRLHF